MDRLVHSAMAHPLPVRVDVRLARVLRVAATMADEPRYYLDALTAFDCEAARKWRNPESVRAGLRTPYVLTAEMQEDFYRNVVCDRNSRHRYWAVREGGGVVAVEIYGGAVPDVFVAMVGLTDLQWENGVAEISLMVDPDRQGKGIGTAALRLTLTEAFDRLRLLAVHGEVYEHNPAVNFWRRHADGEVLVPYRKYWDGVHWGAVMFWFTPDGKWRDR